MRTYKIMCGIIAYSGSDNAIPYLIDGIRRLEYRGYDSFGGAFLSSGNIDVRKDKGRIDDIVEKFEIDNVVSNTGICHTRWATNGGVEKRNAHPIQDCTGRIAVAHNGIIENWKELRQSLKGHKFVSDTDTEVISHIIESRLTMGESLLDAVKHVSKVIKGASAFVVMDKKSDRLVALKQGNPLVVGIAANGVFVSSDVPSFVKQTNKVIYLSDGDIVSFGRNGYDITNVLNPKIRHEVTEAEISPKDIDKKNFKHFMLKEIFEQFDIINKLENYDFSRVRKAVSLIKAAPHVYLIGAGTSFFAARFGARLLRDSGVKATAIQGQELDNYSKIFSKDDLIILVSQSGETADILSALPYIENNKKIAIVNVLGSAVAREADLVIDMGAGPEYAVAATKSLMLTLINLVFLASSLKGEEKEALNDMKLLNLNKYNLLVPSTRRWIGTLASKLAKMKDIIYLGRDAGYILSLEGALKMKEIAYIHAEAIDSSALKHGPLALITKNSYVVATILPESKEKMLYNLNEIKARHGKIVGIATEKSDLFDYFVRTVHAGRFDFVPALIVLQLLAYRTATVKGLDVDHPRNLAKAVTVK